MLSSFKPRLTTMPEMTGVEFLMEAIQFYPQAKRVLLTAYADIQAAIDSINEVGLNYYLMKPWHPPEEKLYPILDELLEDWKAHAQLPETRPDAACTSYCGRDRAASLAKLSIES